MDPASIQLVMLGLIQAAKFATTLAEQVGNGEITPEDAQARWKLASAEFNQAADQWFATPPGISQG